MIFKPQDVAHELGISPSTLRLWSARFADLLSDQARKLSTDGFGTTAQRRYVEADVAVFLNAKELLNQGLTYDEVSRRLGGNPAQRPSAESSARDYSLPHPSGEPAYRIPPQDVRATESFYRSQGLPYRQPPAYPPIGAHLPGSTQPTQGPFTPRDGVGAVARDRTIADLTRSSASLDSRLRKALSELRDLKLQEVQMRKEIDRLRFVVEILVAQRRRPWWKRLLAIPEAPWPEPLAPPRQRP